ncbi:hypothetical protein COV18_01545 [Candidatus Woesearchaeota archaeon CG10_big_fil_rev_8_21_14_0_10_37_12]|nr:MAG: hypothetical protein COV18_01545 [Candidatus Woesearchaeota archaeon CG10_big_fil_rev_8_21_14_0_10_37_12]
MDTQTLEEIGLTHAEIKVYLALLGFGTATAGPILDKTGLHNSVVHTTLNRLIEKGLVSFIKEGKRNHYQAANPKHILTFLDDKKERVQEIIPELLAKQQTAKEKPEVITFRGVRGVKELLYELLEAGGNKQYTLGSTEKAFLLPGTWWESYHKKRAAKGIKAKIIFNESLKYWKAETKYKKAEIRYTKKGFEPLTEIIIRNDKVGIIIWTEKPMGVLFHNKALADSYEKHFQLIWNQAK